MSFDNNQVCVLNVCNNLLGVGFNIRSITANYTVASNDVIILADASGGAIAVTLTTNTILENQNYIIKKTDSSTNAVTVLPHTGGTIEGNASFVLCFECEVVSLVRSASNWRVVNQKVDRLLTTKGDMYVHDGSCLRRLPVGFDGQLLTADSTASVGVAWKNAPTLDKGSNSVLTIQRHLAISTVYTTVALFPWELARNSTFSSAVIIFNADIANRDMDVRLQDTTNVVTLGSLAVTSSGVKLIPLTNPVSNARLELQIRRSAVGGTDPVLRSSIYNAVMSKQRQDYQLRAKTIIATGTAYTTVAIFPWFLTRYGAYSSGTLVLESVIADRDLEFRIRNITLAADITTGTISASGFSATAFTSLPAASARIEFQIRKSAAGGTDPFIIGVRMEFNAAIPRTTFSVSELSIIAISTTFTTVAKFPWEEIKFFSLISGVIVYESIIVNRDLEIRLQDVTNAVTLGSKTVTTSEFSTFNIGNPTTNAQLELQVRKTAVGGVNPIVKGMNFEYDQSGT